MKKTIILINLLIVSFLAHSQHTEPDFLTNYNKRWVDSVFNTLSTDEKIGQLFMPRGNVSGGNYDREKLLSWVRDYKIGGLVFFASSPTKQAIIVNELQANSKTPMLIGMDLEWGLNMRLDSTVRFPYQMTLGAMQGNNDLIEKMGAEIGWQCKRMGIHVNYAPVVDVNNNPNNPVINFRSFGEDKLKVTEKALAYMKGQQSQHILTSAKHFPGHGDTDVDSHADLPLINHDRQHLDAVELYPYKELINQGLAGVMVAHLSIPALDSTQHLASTLSKRIVTDILRKDLNFKGLVFTDAMDMQGAVKYFPNGTANVKAILAGNDVLETFIDVPTAFNAIKTALAKGEISQAELDERVKRILMAKSWVGLDNYKPIEIKNLTADLTTKNADLLNRQFAENTVTLLKNEGDILPLKNLDKYKIASISIDAEKPTDFQKMLANYTTIDQFQISAKAADSTINRVMEAAKNYDLLLIGVHLSTIRPAAKYGITDQNLKLIKQLAATGKAIISLFGNTYSLGKLEDLDKAKALIMAYQLTSYSEEATAQAIFGGTAFKGKLPVTVNDKYKLNDGITTTALGRLQYSSPEMVGIDSQQLNSKIDSVVNLALTQKATPGCVVEIVKDGKVILRKPYGYQTYDKVRKVELDNLYDFASVTKISTSTLAVMQLMSEGKFDLDKTFKDYYPEFANSNKADLRFRDMLTHKSGLKAWIPFWMDCIDSVATVKNSPVFQQKYAQQFHQNFFQRLFGKKKNDLKIAKAIKEDKNLWKDCLTAESLVWKPNTFSTTESAEYPIRVAEKLWIQKDYHEKIYAAVRDSPIKPNQGYVYSDMHYYFYPLIVPRITGVDWETYLKNTYHQLGANSLTYKPLRFISPDKIVPTELDTLFRKNLIHGRVHDEGAAMLDGISGHAGLFGTADDLTKLMEMYLQKGYYGGKQFIKPEVIAECTKYQFPELKNRRGIGFDKLDFNPKITNGPRSASPESYGHSGYTGTFTWVDPTYNLVYVFMANRVYPTRDNSKLSDLNIRTEIMEQVYKLIKK